MAGVNDRLVEAEARIGTVLRGKWRLDGLLGIGGTAAVYRAQHKNQSRVAVKILHRRLALSVEQINRFQREGYAANRVGHPGVPEVYDDDVDEHGSAFLVMELLSGQTVADRATACGGRLPIEEVLDVADRVLEVLAAAHARGILHRDIKPENLFATEAGEIKVLDFGIARFSDPELDQTRTEAGTLLGTPAFVPPEQARGLVDVIDARTDLWAVGATMFTLLTGRFVHEGTTPAEQVGLAMTASARSLVRVMPDAPAALVAIVDRSLAYSQKDRWQDAHSMLEAVRWTRTHWEEIETSPERVPEEWTTHAHEPLGRTTTLGEQQPVSSGLRPNPGLSSRVISFAAPAVAVVLLAAGSWGIASSWRSTRTGSRPAVAAMQRSLTESAVNPQTVAALPAPVSIAPPAQVAGGTPPPIRVLAKHPSHPNAPRAPRPAESAASEAPTPTAAGSAEPAIEPEIRDPYDRRH